MDIYILKVPNMYNYVQHLQFYTSIIDYYLDENDLIL